MLKSVTLNVLMKKVDIIIASYNRKAFLKRAVRSVYEQTYKDWNLIIVDDGSTDETFLEDYGSQTKFFRLLENKGVSFARNYGIQKSSAEWLAFLDSDDEWKPSKLEKQMQLLQEHSSAKWLHCNELWIKNQKILHQKKKHKKTGARIFDLCVSLCCVSPSAVVIKRELFEELGVFREDFPVCEDYELWLRLSASYPILFLEEALIVKHGGHLDQLSFKFKAMDYWRVKALLPFLNDQRLSKEEKQKVRESLLKRTKILLKGYKKHKNFKNQDEIQNIYESLKKEFI